jgi:peptidoglycan/xylan/chitin deacetylase (PgdA/CDA1 family)
VAVTAVAAVLLAFCGCGSGPSSDPRGGSPATTAAPRSAAAHAPSNHGALPTSAAQQAAVQRFADLGRPIYCGARHGRLVALTFDDGPGQYTHVALRELRRAGARATFFLVGTSVAQYPGPPRRERELGAIGEHTMTHPHLRSLPLTAAMAEIRNGRSAALAAAGPPVDLFRPPYGEHSDAIDRELSRDGMAEILWDVDSDDSRVSPPADYREISADVRRNIRPGSIVLMHENRGQTIRALRGILPALRRRGLRSVSVPELLAADPPSAVQLAAGRRGCGASDDAAGSGA